MAALIHQFPNDWILKRIGVNSVMPWKCVTTSAAFVNQGMRGSYLLMFAVFWFILI